MEVVVVVVVVAVAVAVVVVVLVLRKSLSKVSTGRGERGRRTEGYFLRYPTETEVVYILRVRKNRQAAEIVSSWILTSQ